MRVLIVDDSAFMRTALANMFRADGGWDVRTARDGNEALVATREFDPDVVTLDVNMPGMDGLTCLSHIMTESPRPVVMVSSLTTEGATSTLEALAMGAVDFVPKPSGTVSLDVKSIGAEIVERVRCAAGSKRNRRVIQRRAVAKRPAPAPSTQTPARPGLVVIGCSTGGPRALEDVVAELPADFPLPIVVAQHMPAGFTKALADRLDTITPLNVVEVDGMVPLRPGVIAIGKGDADVIVSRRGDTLRAVSVPTDSRYGWHPSVDRLVTSAGALLAPEEVFGVLMTGMGNDGARTLADLKRRGAYTIAESEQSCVVFGMPGSLVQLHGATTVLPSDAIGKHLSRTVKARRIPDGAG